MWREDRLPHGNILVSVYIRGDVFGNYASVPQQERKEQQERK